MTHVYATAPLRFCPSAEPVAIGDPSPAVTGLADNGTSISLRVANLCFSLPHEHADLLCRQLLDACEEGTRRQRSHGLLPMVYERNPPAIVGHFETGASSNGVLVQVMSCGVNMPIPKGVAYLMSPELAKGAGLALGKAARDALKLRRPPRKAQPRDS